MDGFGRNEDLPPYLDTVFESAWIFHGNPAKDGDFDGGQGIWERLQPGHGTSFKADSTQNFLSSRFGVELSFAHHMQQLYPKEKIAIIKYSHGGSSIDRRARIIRGSWDPDFRLRKGINQYDHFLRCIELARQQKDIDGDGRNDHWVPTGIIWMQGESDALLRYTARKYYGNLSALMDLIRASFGSADMPVVLGKISDRRHNKRIKVWRFGSLVQEAQEEFARTDRNAAIVRSTEKYNYSDLFHYDSAGYIDLGEEFGEAYRQMRAK